MVVPPTSAQIVVETTHGKVRGKLRTTVYDDKYYCFDAIPYGRAPIGELRFRAPQPAAAWHGILDCTEVAPKCVQFNNYTKQVEGSEDCLFLNIYAKRLQSEQPLPVMVYLYGGGFTTGNATRNSWGPDYFMMQDVIFITIGYRVGILGFLSFSEPELQVPGNAGLKDIVLALQWIKQNCRNFNGNAENITLFGHSAGSIATQLLMLAPQCQGLFHKAILMSGSCMRLHTLPNLAYRLAKHAGYEGTQNSSELLEYLRTVAADKLVHYDFWTQEEKNQGHYIAFQPCVEPYRTAEAILTSQPCEVLAQCDAWCHAIPLILGGTSCEGLIEYKTYKTNPALYDVYAEHPEYFLPRELQISCDIATQKRLAPKFIDTHFGNRKMCVENGECAMDKISYELVYHANHNLLNLRLPHSRAATYLYRFDFDSPTFNLYRIKKCGPNLHGAAHVDDLSYIFYMPESFKLTRSSAEYRTVQRMIAMWTAFAARSDPNTPLIAPAVWLPVAAQGVRKCLNISHDISCIDYPEAEKCATWDGLYAEAGLQSIQL